MAALNAIVFFIFQLDRSLAALLMGAQLGETMSLMCAQAQAAKVRWGCVGCRLLSIFVQRNHCQLVLVPGATPMPLVDELRAGLLLILLALLVCAAPFVWFFFVLALARLG